MTNESVSESDADGYAARQIGHAATLSRHELPCVEANPFPALAYSVAPTQFVAGAAATVVALAVVSVVLSFAATVAAVGSARPGTSRHLASSARSGSEPRSGHGSRTADHRLTPA